MPGFGSKLVDVITGKAFLPETPLIGELNPVKPEQRSFLNKIIGDRVSYERFSPEAMKLIAEEYLGNLGLGENVTFSAEAFDNHAKGRVKDFQGLKEAKTPTDELIFKKLSEETKDDQRKAAMEAVQNDLNSIFSTSPTDTVPEHPFIKAQKDYNESVETFSELVKLVPSKYRVENLLGAMKEIIDNGKSDITKQQADELAHLEDKFNNEEFKTNLKKALTLSTDEQLEQVKKNIQDDLTSTHKKQLEEFDKSTQESMRNLHQASANQMKEFLFIAELHKSSSKMQAMIEMLAAENRAKLNQNEINTTLTLSEDKADISSVHLEQLEFIQRLGGEKISKITQKNEAGEDIPVSPLAYKLDMGTKIFNPRYYLTGQDKKDLLTMAQAIRASGSTTITMKLNYDNPKVAEQRARDAFEACSKSGFPLDKIKIEVNGKLLAVTPTEKDEKDGRKYESIREQLYSKKTHSYDKIIQKSEEIRADLEALTKPPAASKGDELKNIKEDMNKLRAVAAAKKVPKPADPEPQPLPGLG